MTRYALRDLPDGSCEITEMRPVVVARTLDRAFALRVVLALQREETQEEAGPASAEEVLLGDLPALLEQAPGQVLDALAAGAAAVVARLPSEAAELAPLAPPPADEEPPPEPRAPSPEPRAPSPEPRAPSPEPGERAGAPDMVMERAIDRVLGGEANAAVAAALGVGARSLHTHVLNRKRALAKLAAPAPAAASADSRKEPCSACGTPMLPTVDHPDLCHRCRP